ncbi:MAG: TAXI family TRAP transporter solute-binding subunit [Lawsonibacter sp.]
MKITKRILSFALALASVLTLTACGSNGSSNSEAQPGSSAAGSAAAKGTFGNGDTYFLTIAAPPASSALYSFWVGLGDSLSGVYSNIKPTVSESQGAVAITKSVRLGDADFGNSVSATDFENYNGTGTFNGDPNADLRMLFYYEVTWEMFCVNASTGITDITGLDGQKFNPGGTGTSAEQICKNILNTFQVNPNYFDASQSDAADAYANKEVIGTCKLGPAVDSYVMQLDASSQVALLSLTNEQVETVIASYPYLIQGIIPADTYDGVDYDVRVVGTPQGCQMMKDTFTQEEQYQLCKAIFEDGAAAWQSAYPTGAGNDLCELTLQSSVPLAAGTVQYLVEKGYDVPADIIPEEYVPVA